ncbi:MAG: NAD(P)-dependent oxidoreductase [Burkholderiaceae bacterium]
MSSITVSVYTDDRDECAQWCAALGRALGAGYRIVAGTDAAARYAVAWGPPETFFAAQPALHAVFSMAAGVDHLLRVATLPAGLPVYRLEDAGMAAQMVRYCRHEVEHVLLDRATYEAQQRRKVWQQHPVREPGELQVGLFGYGVLGGRVAQALHDEGYAVRAFRRAARGDSSGPIAEYAGSGQWPAFLQGLQVLILLAPLTEDTRGIIDGVAIDAMARGAWLVNVGRGALIDETAVLAALTDGRLAGASFDVFATEPLPANHPFWSMPQVRMTPHVAAVTRIGPSAHQIADRIRAIENGDPAGRAVDRASGY